MGETEKRAFNGTALFRSLRLRGSEGLQNVTFTGQVINPPRDLVPDQVRLGVLGYRYSAARTWSSTCSSCKITRVSVGGASGATGWDGMHGAGRLRLLTPRKPFLPTAPTYIDPIRSTLACSPCKFMCVPAQ